MAQLILTASDAYITSSWQCTGYTSSAQGITFKYSTPEYAYVTRSFSLAGVPAGASIQSAIASASRNGAGTVRIENYAADQVDVTAKVAPQSTYDMSLSFKATGGYGATTQSDVGKTYSATAYVSGITLTVTYTPPYGSCTAPSSVSVSPSTVAYGKSATLAWSGASAGSNNPITKYEVYRADSASGAYALLGSATGTSYAVTARGVAGAYYYKVKTIGTVSGYDSALSTAYAVLTAKVDEAVAPAYVTASPALYESGDIFIAWPAGSGGSGAAITYGIQYATSTGGTTWGGWVQLATTSTLNYSHAPELARGSYIKYRVCTIVSAYSLTSGYTESGTVRRNQAPVTPVWVLPAANATTHSANPSIKVTVSAEPDGQSQTVQASIDGDAYYTLATLSASGGTVTPVLSLSAGTHTIVLRVADTLGATSATASRSITYTAPTWARTIATGTVIANTSISHQADILELLSGVNAARAYYGLSTITLPGSVGNWKDWQGQMQALQSALTACADAAGKTAPIWSAVSVYPTANVIHQIRAQIGVV